MELLLFAKAVLVFACLSGFPLRSHAITTTHHDKPVSAQLSTMLAMMEEAREATSPPSAKNETVTESSLPVSERQRRLVPYMTFYLSNSFNQPNYQIVGTKAQNYQPLRQNKQPQQQLVKVVDDISSSVDPTKQNYEEYTQPQLIKLVEEIANTKPAYVQQQVQQPLVKIVEAHPTKFKYTPFLNSNKLPGRFTPIQRPQAIKINYVQQQPQPQILQTQQQPRPIKMPDYSEIYDKLSQLKLQYNLVTPTPATVKYQGGNRFNPYLQKYIPNNRRPITTYIPLHEYQDQHNVRPTTTYLKPVSGIKAIVQTYSPPTTSSGTGSGTGTSGNIKTIVQTYTPATIDIPSGSGGQVTTNENDGRGSYEIYEPQTDDEYVQIPPPKQQQQQQQQLQQQHQQPQYTIDTTASLNQGQHILGKPYTVEAVLRPKPISQPPKQYLVEVIRSNPQKQYYQPPRIPVHRIPIEVKPYTPKPASVPVTIPIPVPTPIPQTLATTGHPPYLPTDDSNTLARILKNLQDTNALPHTLTPDNIDNSIKTLVRILSALKTQGTLNGIAGVPPVKGKFSKPIVVQDDEGDYEEGDEENETVLNLGGHNDGNGGGIITSTVTHAFPANNPEGSTPGQPGIDYPALSRIPKTSFNCKTQRYKGFFGDPDTNCQVWHYCDLNGGQASFLCPNGTIFSQVALTCDWWYNVKCSTTTQLYVLNERLYKYILPFRPKFPEDYSGPLVDKYLALKFEEMEERMRKEKKGKGNTSSATEDNDTKKEIDELQLLEDGNKENLANSQEAEQEVKR